MRGIDCGIVTDFCLFLLCQFIYRAHAHRRCNIYSAIFPPHQGSPGALCAASYKHKWLCVAVLGYKVVLSNVVYGHVQKIDTHAL